MTDFLDALISIAAQTAPFSPILRGPLTAAPSISMEMTQSSSTAHMDHRKALRSRVSIRVKHQDLPTALGAAEMIQRQLNQQREYPCGEGWQIVNVFTESAPSLMGREKNNAWLVEASIGVWVYFL